MREKDVDLKAALIASEQIIPALRKGRLDPQIVEVLLRNPAMWNYVFFHMRTGDVTLNDIGELVKKRTDIGAYLMNNVQMHAYVLMGDNFVNLYSFAQAMRGFLRFDKKMEERAAQIPFSKETLLWAKAHGGILFPGHAQLHLHQLRDVFGVDERRGTPYFSRGEMWGNVPMGDLLAVSDEPWHLVVPVPEDGFKDQYAPEHQEAHVTEVVAARLLAVRTNIRPPGKYGWPDLSIFLRFELSGKPFHLYCHGGCVQLDRPVHDSTMTRMISVLPEQSNTLDDQVCCPHCSFPDIRINYTDPLRVTCRNCGQITVIGRGPVCEHGHQMSWYEGLKSWQCATCPD